MQKLNHLFQRTENKKNCKNLVVLLTILYHWNILLHISVLQFMFFLSMFSPHQGEFSGSQAHPVPSPFPVRSVHGQTSNNTGIYQGRVWVPDVNVREVSLCGFPMVFNLCISDFQSFAVWLQGSTVRCIFFISSVCSSVYPATPTFTEIISFVHIFGFRSYVLFSAEMFSIRTVY